ncbi:DUF4402 domain-containing protein, partial [Pelomonas sp. KK5]|uniref:DUF4402 domain-containing protein n=1 Tax=Pelomonas sp. KK5 TaxID=1855730 RepID=UPI00117C5819
QDSPASAATINISGTSNAAIAITLPADGTVLLSAGPATMALNGFTSSPSGSGVLSAGGTLLLSIGATLSVGLAQTPGSYSGSFNVSIDYQ